MYNKNIDIANQIYNDSKFIKYGKEKEIIKYQLCVLTYNKNDNTDFDQEFKICKENIKMCQNRGLKNLYSKQLSNLIRAEKLFNT